MIDLVSRTSRAGKRTFGVRRGAWRETTCVGAGAGQAGARSQMAVNLSSGLPFCARGRPRRSKMESLDGNHNGRILVVDDSEGIHGDFDKVLYNPDPAAASARLDELASSLFGEEKPQRLHTNFQVTHARQGEEAFELVLKSLREHLPYALAFVDVRMPPGWDGLHTIEQIWGHDTEIEIVLCTAYSDDSWEEIATRLPHAERLLILRKPFDPLEVRQLAYGLTAKWLLRRQTTCRMHDLKMMVVQRMRDIEALRTRLAEVVEQQRAGTR
jgi:CheY-like chemotaxis protein